MCREKWRTAWITGASSGLGRALAIELASQGVLVAASARSSDKLAVLAADYPTIRAYPLDVTDSEALSKTAQEIETDLGSLDLAIFNAGTYEPVGLAELNPDGIRRVMAVNFHGAVDGVLAVSPGMRKQKSGQIAVVASLAGYRGLPASAAYGATKAALINFSESIYPELRKSGIQISVVNPGFVETPMTAKNDFPMPFIMTADDASRRTIAGLMTGKFEIAYPRRFVAILKFMRVLPYTLYFAITQKWMLKK